MNTLKVIWHDPPYCTAYTLKRSTPVYSRQEILYHADNVKHCSTEKLPAAPPASSELTYFIKTGFTSDAKQFLKNGRSAIVVALNADLFPTNEISPLWCTFTVKMFTLSVNQSSTYWIFWIIWTPKYRTRSAPCVKFIIFYMEICIGRFKFVCTQKPNWVNSTCISFSGYKQTFLPIQNSIEKMAVLVQYEQKASREPNLLLKSRHCEQFQA